MWQVKTEKKSIKGSLMIFEEVMSVESGQNFEKTSKIEAERVLSIDILVKCLKMNNFI
jgi:hypothetical protein